MMRFSTGLLATTGAGTLWRQSPTRLPSAVCSQFGMDSFATTFWPLLFNRLPQMSLGKAKI